ncbi:hypothetical protein L596_024746 [Steinernema carpocapsae]|uniref:Nose resistant-to-fluoxetine protein N-terminal domain-containing protein n=1 Tax=Steinernema carpocapsae TaxID=34508 RepID=A0A4V6XVR2_STECR|nr:hypothetical protein L596_024746 [Steinernema carpocapsae]
MLIRNLSSLLLFCLLPLSLASEPQSHADAYLYDDEEASVLSSMISEFMHDSEMQLILDLDLFRHFFSSSERSVLEAVQTGDVDYLNHILGLLEPLSHYDVSAPCLADLSHFIWTAIKYAKTVERRDKCANCSCSTSYKQEFSKNQWIFNVIDAMGKVPAAVTGGNNLWIGSWHTCRKISIQKNRQGQLWNGQYCMAHFQPYNRNNPLKAFASSGSQAPNVTAHCSGTAQSANSDWSEDDYKCFDMFPLLNYGLCTPDTCTEYDVQKIMQFFYQSLESAAGKKLVCNVEIVCRNDRPESSMSNDSKSMAMLFFVGFIAVLMVFSSLYDYIVYQKEIKPLSGDRAALKSFQQGNSWFIRCLLAFSMYTNAKGILKTAKGEDQIHCLHGVRVLSMAWIILGHTYYYICTSMTTDNLFPTLQGFPKYFHNQIIVQAPLAVDSFFYLSGMLTCFLFFKKFPPTRSIFNVGMWAMYYVRRYLRLTPVYVVIMGLMVTLFTYISDGPFWRPIERQFCRTSYWANLIYLNNFLPLTGDACMGWTWYMANDMQFHIFSPILIIMLYKLKKVGVAGAMGLIVASAVIKLTIMMTYDYPPAPLLTSTLTILTVLNDYWNDVYVKPYVRCGPYITGILTGYTLYKCNMKIKLSAKQVALGWTVSTLLGLYSVFGLYNYALTGEISEWYKILYVLFGRPAYAVALAWVTFACATGHGGPVNRFLSWRAFIPLSRITFCAYLIHPILLQLYNFSRPHPFHFTTTYQMITIFAGSVIVSYFIAFFLSLAFEVPVGTLEAMFFDWLLKPKRGQKSENGTVQNGLEKRGSSAGGKDGLVAAPLLKEQEDGADS